MKLFHVRYGGHTEPVFASDFVAARRLGILHLADTLGVVDIDKVAVIEAESAAGYWPPFETSARLTSADLWAFQAEINEINMINNGSSNVEIKQVLAEHFLRGDPL